jgi:hypothetical protein
LLTADFNTARLVPRRKIRKVSGKDWIGYDIGKLKKQDCGHPPNQFKIFVPDVPLL